MLEVKKGPSPEIIKTENKDNALYLYMERGSLRIAPVSSGIIRVSMTYKDSFADSFGVGVNAQEAYGEFNVAENDVEICIETDNVKACVNKKTASISFCDKSGKLLLKEKDKNSKILDAFQSYKTIIDDKTVIRKVVTPDGVKNVIDYATKEPDKELYHTTVYFDFQDDEVLYGLGQHDDGVFNLRGTIRYLHQANLKIAIPMMVSSIGYGLFVPTGSPAIFSDLPYEDSYFYTEADEELNYYFIYGPSFDEIIGGYRKLSGKASLLPKWMFGFVQSQERYETQDDIVSTAKKIREKGIGCDVIVQDWYYWEEDHWGQKIYEPSRYPDPKKMIDDIHELDMRYMISIWPIMNEKTVDYKEMKEHDKLLPATEIYDAFDEEARKLYWKQTNDGIYKYGVDAWWCDSAEPFTPEWAKYLKPLPEKNYEEYLSQTSQTMPDELANAYGLYHARGLYEGQRSVNPDKRLANLTRNAYTGAQKYGVILWSGDIAASWSTYKKQIAVGLNFCASGMPYWTLDIGAFFVKDGEFWYWSGDYDNGLDDLGYKELYVRWYQFGAFLPIFRAHGTDVRRELWALGDKGDMFYDAALYVNQLRYKLLPYIYSCAGSVWEKDKTIMRLLAFDFPDDKEALLIDDQYMFGESIMVCPVTTPMYYDKNSEKIDAVARTRQVYLPEYSEWYDFYTDKKYKGGQYIDVDAPLDKIPLFIKAGSIIPMSAGNITNVTELKSTGIDIHVYPGKDAAYELYEDAGDGYSYETGDFSKRKFTWNDSLRKLETINDMVNEYAVQIVSEIVH